MAENYANNISTTLNGAINAAVTSLVVTSATGFPAANFRIVIDNEILLVTAKAGTTFTVTRGAEGSTAASHSNGAAIDHDLTAASLDTGILERIATHTAVPDAHHNQTHGAGDHTDVTRSFLIDPEALRDGGTTAVTVSSTGTATPDQIAYWPFADTFDSGVRGAFMVPGDWVSGMGVQVYWMPSTTVVSNVAWSFTYRSSASGDNHVTAGTTVTTWVEAVGTANIVQIGTEQTASTGVSANELYRFTVRRMASTAATDTYTGAARLLGVRFNYTASG